MPEQTQQHSYAKLFLWLGLLVLLLIAVSVVAVLIGISKKEGMPVTSEAIRFGEAPRPALTETTKEKLRISRGFQALVSHTDRGFEPTFVEISVGQAVRFTNNSSETLYLQIGATVVRIEPQDFYEQAFDVLGEYVYVAGEHSGTVRVQ